MPYEAENKLRGEANMNAFCVPLHAVAYGKIHTC